MTLPIEASLNPLIHMQEIHGLDQHQAMGDLAVAACTAGLLDVVDHVRRRIQMDHCPDIGNIDAHAESGRRCEYLNAAIHEELLNGVPLRSV